MTNRPIAGRASRRAVCPVCGTGTKGCSHTDDGQHYCRGEPADPPAWKLVKRGEPFNTYRRTDVRHERGPAVASGTGHANGKPQKTLGERMLEFNVGLTPGAWDALLADLGLPRLPYPQTPKARPVIGMGFTEWAAKAGAGEWVGAWTFGMADGRRELCGIAKRFDRPVSVSGGEPTNKLTMRGSTAGLFLGRDWDTRPGPLLIPEGASDTLVLALLGFAVVGRPSNTGGLDQLSELLKGDERPVIVLGENDARPDPLDPAKTLWPGKDGADKTAGGLAEALGRAVLAAYPPGPPGGDAAVKDWREWACDLLAGQGEGMDLEAVAAEVRTHCERTATPVTPADQPDERPAFTFIDSATFAGGDYRPRWLIPDVLVAEQPGVIGGPSKGMKTSIAGDMLISMAAGKPFLGRFDVPRPVRVAFVSGESGPHTLQEAMYRICEAKGITPADLGDRMHWCFDLPRFLDPNNMTEFAARLLALNVEVVVIDPVYLCIGGAVDAKNLYEMGGAFRVVAEVLLRNGVTPLLCHHANRMLKVGVPMELTDLAYSGLDQFTRQFVFINRITPYQSDGEHDLWVRIGGSAGHGALLAVHVSEGITDTNFKGRKWDVTVATTDEAKVQREAAKEERKRRELREQETKVFEAIDAEVSKGHEAATSTRIATLTGIDKRKLELVVARLLDDDAIELHEFVKTTGKGRRQECKGYRRVPLKGDSPDLITATEDRLHQESERQKAGLVVELEIAGAPPIPPPTGEGVVIGGGESPYRGDSTSTTNPNPGKRRSKKKTPPPKRSTE